MSRATTPETLATLDPQGWVLKTEVTGLHPLRTEYDAGRVAALKHGPDPDTAETWVTAFVYKEAAGHDNGYLDTITDAMGRVMQADSTLQPGQTENLACNAAMPRKLSKPRPRQGLRLAELRRAANFSPAALGRLVGESQQNIAFWEQSDKPPRSDMLPKLARVLGVSVEQVLTVKTPIERRNGPVGKVRKLFEEVSELPRRQQEKVVEFVSALVEQYKGKAS